MRTDLLFGTTKGKYLQYIDGGGATLAPSYLNNKLDIWNELKIWEYKWYRTKRTLLNHKDEEPTNEGEAQLLGDYQPVSTPDSWEGIVKRIRDQDRPIADRHLCKLGYRRCEELDKLVRGYRKYYPEKGIPRQAVLYHPNCNMARNG